MINLLTMEIDFANKELFELVSKPKEEGFKEAAKPFLFVSDHHKRC
jgi:hypothetical protein